jgi:hypothetical protein
MRMDYNNCFVCLSFFWAVYYDEISCMPRVHVVHMYKYMYLLYSLDQMLFSIRPYKITYLILIPARPNSYRLPQRILLLLHMRST